jgi:hypothetical protein
VSTKYVAYTWQLTKDEAERGYEGRHSVMYVCNVIAENTVINTCKYSTSDITEMAENNGAMDVDPEGHRVYGPYGKRTVNLMWKIICICKILMRCSVLDSGISKNVRYKYEKMLVRRNEYRSTRITEYITYMHPEAVVTYTWSARSKDVYIQSSSWHKEYGE